MSLIKRGPSRGHRSRWLCAYSLISGFVSHAAMAQAANAAAGTQTSTQIKEITVTAERRTQSLQKVAASIEVVKGSDIEAQGKITTQQILEDVPNVYVGQALNAADPNGNITIRGVLSSQNTQGIPAPSTTATYVDDVYSGIGGDFDVSRVEVLRGPQGTLYGRSATGGVVAFHTADPELNKFGGFITGEYGTADLRQAILAVNMPIGQQIAVRVSAREFDQHGYFPNPAGAATRDQEARIKLLYQPLSNLTFLGSVSINEQHAASGGVSSLLSTTDPNEVLYTAGHYSTPVTTESRWHQIWLNTKYDFGAGTLTYITAYHNYVTNGNEILGNNSYSQLNPLNQVHTEEVRVASSPGSPLTWLVGANFYSNQFKLANQLLQDVAYQADGALDTTPGTTDALIHSSYQSTRIFDYGLFTEETYAVLPSLKITAGARVDESKVTEFDAQDVNQNIDAYNNLLNPPDSVFGSLASSRIFRNFTYKLRAEYDIAPAHMVYAMVSTGFLPGEQQLVSSNTGQAFRVVPFAQERLTSYEIGSKNRFLNNTLQINGDLFYYNYSGYEEEASLTSEQDDFTLLSVPLHIAGAELDALWLFTPEDRFSFTGGITDAELQGNPFLGNGLGYVSEYLALRRLPGVVPVQFTAAYSHTITFGNGSSLIPRAQARFYGAYNVNNLTAGEVALGEQPFVHQAATVIGDLDLDWTSPAGRYSVDGYIRNIANNMYKVSVGANSTVLSQINVTTSNPRVLGVVLTAKF